MENQNARCYRCGHCERFYVQAVKQFDKSDCGWCSVRRTVVNIHDGCDRFRLKPLRGKDRKRIERCLNDMLTEMSQLRMLIEECDNDGKQV